jgi:hypothetical protein
MLYILQDDHCLLQVRKVDERDGLASLVERLAAGFREISRKIQEPAIATMAFGFLVSAKCLTPRSSGRVKTETLTLLRSLRGSR